MTTASLTLTNESHVEELGFEIYVNDDKLYDEKILIGKTDVRFDLPEEDGDYTLTLALKGKGHHHTILDTAGNIIKDVLIKISDVRFDGVDVDSILFDQADYLHDYNGNGPETVESYLGVLGCNGRVVLKFSCPVYIWILENS